MHGEITLDELLSEPIILTLMARDGVSRTDILRLAETVRRRNPPPPTSLHVPEARIQPHQLCL